MERVLGKNFTMKVPTTTLSDMVTSPNTYSELVPVQLWPEEIGNNHRDITAGQITIIAKHHKFPVFEFCIHWLGVTRVTKQRERSGPVACHTQLTKLGPVTGHSCQLVNANFHQACHGHGMVSNWLKITQYSTINASPAIGRCLLHTSPCSISLYIPSSAILQHWQKLKVQLSPNQVQTWTWWFCRFSSRWQVTTLAIKIFVIKGVLSSVGQSMTETKKSSHMVIDLSMTFDDWQTGLGFD